MKTNLVTACAALLAWTTAASQVPRLPVINPTVTHFLATENAPLGPGARALPITIRLVEGDTSFNVAVWVVYGEDRRAVGNSGVGSQVAHGRASLRNVTAEGVASYSFIFPHADHARPNQADANPVSIPSGRTVHYRVVKMRGSFQVSSDIHSFEMPDELTIVNFGDSYASGEGAPYQVQNFPVGGDQDGLWDNKTCNRSNNSGQARAVRTMQVENPTLAIWFMNVACSGAETDEGILEPQLKHSWPLESDVAAPRVQPQVDQVEARLRTRGYEQLNIAMISGGGNDVGFGDVVVGYLILPGEFRLSDTAAQNLMSDIDAIVPVAYRNLKDEFDRRFDYDRVLVSEYPDPLRGKNGDFCDMGFGNPPSEFSALNDAFLQRLNDTIRTTVDGFPDWRYVGGTMAASRRHGICNEERRYFNRDLVESFAVQGDPYGIVHPNRDGHARTYQPVYEAALRDAIADLRRPWAIEAAKRQAREAALARAEEARQARRPVHKVEQRPNITLDPRLTGQSGARPTAGRRPLPPARFRAEQLPSLSRAQIEAARQAARTVRQPTTALPDNRMRSEQD